MKRWRSLGERGQVFLLSLGHCINDLHAVFLPTLMPRFVEELGLSLTQVGFFGFINGITHVVAQPLFGHLADATNRPWYAGFGPMVTALGTGLLPYSPNYAFMLLCVGLYSIGSSAFHPQGCGSVGALVPPERLAFSISLFNVGGTLGGTLSPYYAILLVSLFGLKGLPVTVIPGVFIGVALLLFLPNLGSSSGEKGKDKKSQGMFFQNIFRVLRKVLPVWGISFLTNSSNRAITFFLPLLITSRGGTLLQGGTALFVIGIMGTLASVGGSRMADRIGKRLFIGIMIALGPLLLLPAMYTQGNLALLFFTLGISLLMATSPVLVATAIERAPESRSVASSLMMGVSWGLAGLITFPMGTLADLFDIEAAIWSALFLPWLGMPILLRHHIARFLKK